MCHLSFVPLLLRLPLFQPLWHCRTCFSLSLLTLMHSFVSRLSGAAHSKVTTRASISVTSRTTSTYSYLDADLGNAPVSAPSVHLPYSAKSNRLESNTANELQPDIATIICTWLQQIALLRMVRCSEQQRQNPFHDTHVQWLARARCMICVASSTATRTNLDMRRLSCGCRSTVLRLEVTFVLGIALFGSFVTSFGELVHLICFPSVGECVFLCGGVVGSRGCRRGRSHCKWHVW